MRAEVQAEIKAAVRSLVSGLFGDPYSHAEKSGWTVAAERSVASDLARKRKAARRTSRDLPGQTNFLEDA